MNEGAGSAVITATLIPTYGMTATVNYATSNGSGMGQATAGSDYTPVSGTLTFPPGVTSQTFNVPIMDDAVSEGNEALTLTMSSPISATLGWFNPATLVLIDNEPFTVNSTTDAVDANPGDGVCATAGSVCTLRAAIQEANARAGDDTIILSSGTYTLTVAGTGEDAAATGDLDVAANLTIIGAGADTTIITSGVSDRVIHITGTFNVTISGVTIQNGKGVSEGGGILSNGALTLTNSMTISNTATTFGGGISIRSGTANLSNVTIANNTVTGVGPLGGGIYNFGVPLTVTNSTLSNNSTSGDGGGIFNYGGTVNLNNVTITNNAADSDNNGSGDGGGIYNLPFSFSIVNFKNTLFSGNTDLGGQAPDCSGTQNSEDYNLIENTTGCTITGTVIGNLIGFSANLGPLQNNSGPTLTQALLPGSPAIDAGNPATPGSGGNACEATDQRGVTRPQGPRCDIGAYEYPGAQTSVTPSTSSTLVYTDTTGDNSSVAIPTGAVTQTTTLLYTAGTTTTTAPSGFTFAGIMFTLNAYQGTTLLPGFAFQKPVTVTLTYTDATLGGVSENTLTLDYWTGSAWVDAATSCNPTSTYVRDPAQNRLGVAICHLTEFALFGQRQIYLPLILK